MTARSLNAQRKHIGFHMPPLFKLQKHLPKTSKLTRFGSLRLRDNWRSPCTTVCMWLICSNMQWWYCSSLMCAPLPAEAGCELASGLFCSWYLLRINNTAINPETYTSCYGSRHFSACDQGSHCGVFHSDLLLLVYLVEISLWIIATNPGYLKW